MSFLKIGIDETQQYIEHQMSSYGVTSSLTEPLRIMLFSGSNTNTFYVDGVNGLDSNNGQYATPFKTMTYAITSGNNTPAITNIEIINDTNPYVTPFNSITKDYYIQGALGKTPQLYLNGIETSYSPAITCSGYNLNLAQGTNQLNMVFGNNYVYNWDGVSSSSTLISGFNNTLIKRCTFNNVGNTASRYIFVHNNTAAQIQRFAYYNGSNWLKLDWNYTATMPDIPLWLKDFTLFRMAIPAGTSIFTTPNYNFLAVTSDNQLIGFQAAYNDGVHVTNVPKGFCKGVHTHDNTINNVVSFRNNVFLGCGDGLYVKKEYTFTPGTFEVKKVFQNCDIVLNNITVLQDYYEYDSYGLQIVWHVNDCLYIGGSHPTDGTYHVWEYSPNGNKFTDLITVDSEITSICRQKINALSDIIYIGVKDKNYVYRFDYNTKELTTINLDSSTFASNISFLQYPSDLSREDFYILKRGFTSSNATYAQVLQKKNEYIKHKYNLYMSNVKIKPVDYFHHSGFRCVNSSTTLDFKLLYCNVEDTSGAYSIISTAGINIYIYNSIIKNTFTGVTFIYPKANYYYFNANKYDYTVSETIGLNYIMMYNSFFYNINKISLGGLIDPSSKILNNVFINAINFLLNTETSTTYELLANGNVFLNSSEHAVKCVNNNVTLRKNCFYLNNPEQLNCTVDTDYINVYTSPLFNNLNEGYEDLHLLLTKTGALISSPCEETNTNYSTYNTTFNADGYINLYTDMNVNLTNKLFGGFKITYSNNNTSGDIYLIYTQSEDNTSWVDITSLQYTLQLPNGTGGIFYSFPFFTMPYGQIEIKMVGGSWDDNFGIDLEYWYRDIGIENVYRTLDTDYNTSLEMYLSTMPNSMTIKHVKNDESLTNTLDGYNSLVAKDRQITTLSFDFGELSPFLESEIYKLPILFSLNNYNLKLYFDEIEDDTVNCVGTTKPFSSVQIKSNSILRAYLKSQGYDVTDYVVKITDTSKDWKTLQFKAFYIKIIYNSTTYYKKVLYNDSTSLYLEDTESDLIGISGNCDYNVDYFRCIIPTTSIELLKKYYNLYMSNDNYRGLCMNSIEFVEK
jgi:hypothetical protein